MRYVKRGIEDAFAAEELRRAGYHPLLAQLLSARGVRNEDDAQRFLHPDLSQMYDPFAMKNMAEVADAIRGAVSAGKRIVIFGDYDVDGVTATAALLSYLRSIGANAGYYLPSRHGEGYGLSEASVRSLAHSFDLMITVDCGITALREVDIAKEAGLEVIVTDHHEPLGELPACLCLNPKLGYPFRDLCGAGVAGKLVQALGGFQAFMQIADLVALGTIADIVPLLDENRVLAYVGLKMINCGARPGISALIEVSGLLGKALTVGHVSFSIAPRVNAGGRIGHSGKSVDMMLTDNRGVALETAKELDHLNLERQQQEQEILAAAMRMAQEQDLARARALVLTGEGWNPGVIGIVASRIAEYFSRPAFLLARDGELLVGSGRSVPGVHLFEALNSMSELFVRFGGHEMAAGLTIRFEYVGEFVQRLQACFETMDSSLFFPTAVYDAEAELAQIDLELVRQIERLAPTGQANPAPVFLLRSVHARGARTMGYEERHLRFSLSSNEREIQATGFKMGARATQARGMLDVLAVPEIDTYSGIEQVRLVVRHFEPSPGIFRDRVLSSAQEFMRLYLETIFCDNESADFQRYIRLRDENHLREVALSMISQSLSGVLILCALPETAVRLDDWLRSTPCDALITRVVENPPQDLSVQHALCCPAIPRVGHYKQILVADGVWESAWVTRLLSCAPGTVVYAPRVSDTTRAEMRAIVPDVNEVRMLYRAIRDQAVEVSGAQDFRSFHNLLARVNMKEAKVYLCLRMLREMKLVYYTEQPFSMEVVQNIQGKRDIEATATYRFFHTFCGRSDQSGS